MPGATTKYALPYSVLGDTVASVAQSMQDLAGRTDLLLGETGSFTVASTGIDTTVTNAIVLSRTYPGNNAGANPGSVWLWHELTQSTATAWTWWVDTWTGSASTITGFSIRQRWSTNQSGRVFHWRYLPSL